MKRIITLLVTVLIVVGLSMEARADLTVINPVDDGSIYSSGAVITTAYLLTDGDIQGAVIFPTNAINGPVSQALLSVNPYGLPLWQPTMQVFGYATNSGQLTFSDYNAGTYLGTWTLPSNLGYGQDAFFDVSTFLSSVTTPYVGFNLVTPSDVLGPDVFSSLEYNYGQPAQLIVSTTPLPAASILFASSLIGLIGLRKKLQQ